MSGRFLVTGARGFIGSRLAAHLEAQFPAATIIRGTRASQPGDGWVHADVRTTADATRLLADANPDVVFHCAGAGTGNEIGHLFAANVAPSLALLEALTLQSSGVRLVLLGSAAEYGATALRSARLSEASPCEPLSPYGLSKVWQTEGMKMWSRRGAHAVCARLFNVVGRGMPSHLSIGSFALQLAAMRRGTASSVLRTGSLVPRRDFLGVDDACRALTMIASHGRSGEVFNVASGRSISIADALHALARGAGVAPDVQQDEGLVRTNDLPDVVGDTALLQARTGWVPSTPAETVLEDIGRSLT